MKQLLEAQSNLFSISIKEFVISILLSLVLGLFVKYIHEFYSRKFRNYENKVNEALVFIPFLLCTIIIFIGTNLALSLGLVGSLSIIRFRNVINSTSDLCFILWAISLGLGCGTFHWDLTLISFAIFVTFISFITFFQNKKVTCYNTIYINSKLNFKDAFMNYFNNNNLNLRSIKVFNSNFEVNLGLERQEKQDQLVNQLLEIDPDATIHIIGND